MVEITDIILLGLTVFTLSFLIHSLDGPWDVFKKFRESYGVLYNDDGELYFVPDTFSAKLLSCFWCTATWVSLIVCIVYVVIFPFLLLYFLFLVATSIAIAGIVHTYVMR
jgi:hypothetical protein